MKIYLDNCCYNRPYDNQSQLRISLETQAKLFIQDLIKTKQVELVTSYILQYENSQNPFDMRKNCIDEFMRTNSVFKVGLEESKKLDTLAKEIIQTGVKVKDAYHIACAEIAGCDYFLSTDDRLLKYETEKMKLVDPVEFIKIWEVADNE